MGQGGAGGCIKTEIDKARAVLQNFKVELRELDRDDLAVYQVASPAPCTAATIPRNGASLALSDMMSLAGAQFAREVRAHAPMVAMSDSGVFMGQTMAPARMNVCALTHTHMNARTRSRRRDNINPDWTS